jgi:uncharacterized membrane protein YeaQ/YmgE (transglycosylase-associated protein family)
MTIVTWLCAGALVGWFASSCLGNTGREGIMFNVAVAVFGAVFSGWAVAPIFGVSPGFGIIGFVAAAFGAAALLFFVHFVQRTVSR